MRLQLLKRLIVLSFAFLIFGLVYHQLYRGAYYLRLSRSNSIKLIYLPGARGEIYDKTGKVLAGQRLMFNAAILAQQAKNTRAILEKISPILGVSPKELSRRMKRNFSTPFIPTVVARDISKEIAITLEAQEPDIPGLIIQAEPVRDYYQGEDFCHLIGYLGRITDEELGASQQYGLRDNYLVGKSGGEEQFDYYLRGQPGGMQVEVNNRGHLVRVLSQRQPKKGQDIYLTIDSGLQKFINELLDEQANNGACIVINPQNGEIKALVSKPSFNPNFFIAALNDNSQASSVVKGILNSDQAIMINRAISAAYPPGSIFKVVVACAGLETNSITNQTTFNCPGYLQVGNRDFPCWKRDGHGDQDLYSAISHSCNVFFYKLGLKLGVEELTNFARRFGLGAKTGIDLPYESAGLVPSKGWKFKARKERWYDGETANFSIGQGDLLTTPLQMARVFSTIANGGYLVRPHILKKVAERQNVIYRQKLALQKKTLAAVKEGMRQVIESPSGTGYNADLPNLEWAGKTGTAQTSQGFTHAWFAGFFPLDEPQSLILVFLENGGSGGDAPARIAKSIATYICENEI